MMENERQDGAVDVIPPAENITDTPTENVEGQIETPQVPTWNPKEWALKFKGKEIYPKDRNYLITLAQKGYGAERLVEDINKERLSMNEMKGKYSRYEQLEKALGENPQLQQKIWEMVQNGNITNEDQQSAIPPELLKEIEGLKKFKDQILTDRADRDLRDETDKLKNDYPNYDWQSDEGYGTLEDRIKKYALDNNIYSLKSAFRDMMFDQHEQNSKADALKKQKEQEALQKKKGIIMSDSKTGTPKSQGNFDPSRLDYNAIARMAIKETGG